MSDFTQKLRSWSHHRQCLGQAGDDLPQVLRAVCGVYSPHPSGPLSLAARSRLFSPEAFRLLDTAKLALRLPAMRESAYMLDRETAHLSVAAVLPGPEDPSWAKRYGQKGREIPVEHYPAWQEEIFAVATEPMTVAELKLKLKVVPPDKLKFVLNRMGYERKLLRIGNPGLQSNVIAYVSAKAWLGAPIALPDPEEALRWLAGEYLRAFGPARVKDFKWWTSVTAGRAKEAFAGLDLVEVGKGYFLERADADQFAAHDASPQGVVDLLPQWDCYVMGYAPDGRQRFVHPDDQPEVYGKLGATLGNGLGTILVNGLAEGVWFSRMKGKVMEVELKLFRAQGKQAEATIKSKLEQAASWLGAGKLVVK